MSFGITNAKAKASFNGSAFYETTTDATLNNGVYELALSNLSNTPKENDYVGFVENEKVINVYKVNSVDTTKAYMERVYNGMNCLITRIITLNGSEDGWQFYNNTSQGQYWELWGYIHLNDAQTYNSNNIAVARSKEAKITSEYNLIRSGTIDGIYFSIASDLVIKLNIYTVDTLAKFKQYLSENPITIEYTLAEAYRGGLS